MNSLLPLQKLKSIVKHAANTPDKGTLAECGVYKGGSIKFLAQHFPNRKILGFDTFEGLPKEHWNEKEYHKPKEFNDTSLEEVQNFIRPYNNITLVKGLFPDTARFYEGERFAFVHVDFDFYEGTKACLRWFWPRLVVNGIMLFDDYGWQNCPGVKQALDEFFNLEVSLDIDYQAFVKKTSKLKLL